MPRWLRHLPNCISILRILLVVPMALALLNRRVPATIALFAVAAVSDVIDGFLARHFGWQTEIGGLLDPVADKLMLATSFVVLAVLNQVPWWLTASVIARDCIIVLGALSYRMLLGPVAARPTVISKFNTLCQVIFILCALGRLQFAWPREASVVLGALVFVTVVVSGIDYVLVYGRLAARSARAGRGVGRRGSTPA